MSALHLDPLGLCLLRELVEAWNDMFVSSDPFNYSGVVNAKTYQEENWTRQEEYDNQCENFASYLIMVGSPDVDISALRKLWTANLRKMEEDRASGKLWNLVHMACREYIDLYKAE